MMTKTNEAIAPIVPLPLCRVEGCNTVSTRRLYSLVIDGEDQGDVRLCWEHTKEYGLHTGTTYESDEGCEL